MLWKLLIPLALAAAVLFAAVTVSTPGAANHSACTHSTGGRTLAASCGR